MKYFKRFLLLTVLLLLPAVGAMAQSNQNTPEDLGKSKALATQAKDKEALKALIHPDVVTHMEKHDPEKLEEILSAWTVITIPENYLLAIKPVNEIGEYNSKTQTMNVTGQEMYFPVPPSHFMVIVAETQKKDSAGKTQTVRLPLGVDPISQKGGKWYIILPGVKQADQ